MIGDTALLRSDDGQRPPTLDFNKLNSVGYEAN